MLLRTLRRVGGKPGGRNHTWKTQMDLSNHFFRWSRILARPRRESCLLGFSQETLKLPPPAAQSIYQSSEVDLIEDLVSPLKGP